MPTPLTEAIVQPPKLVEHLVAVQVGGDVRLCDVRHGSATRKQQRTQGTSLSSRLVWPAALKSKDVKSVVKKHPEISATTGTGLQEIHRTWKNLIKSILVSTECLQ